MIYISSGCHKVDDRMSKEQKRTYMEYEEKFHGFIVDKSTFENDNISYF